MYTCDHCNNKIKGLITYKCKCNYKILCSKCRLPETHECSFDFINEGKTILKNNNPKIISDKVTIF
jgi:hypothetical protein